MGGGGGGRATVDGLDSVRNVIRRRNVSSRAAAIPASAGTRSNIQFVGARTCKVCHVSGDVSVPREVVAAGDAAHRR